MLVINVYSDAVSMVCLISDSSSLASCEIDLVSDNLSLVNAYYEV